MLLTFKIQYNTHWGQRLCITGTLPELGGGLESRSVPMEYVGNGQWELGIETEYTEEFSYYYLVREDNGYKFSEWGEHRTVHPQPVPAYVFDDAWRENSPGKTYYSSAFTEGWIHHTPLSTRKVTIPKTLPYVGFRLSSVRVAEHICIGICGSCPELGNWNGDKAVLMNDKEFPLWKANVKSEKMPEWVEYKYLLYDTQAKRVITWEAGENRVLHLKPGLQGVHLKMDDNHRYDLPEFKCSGVAIPVFSLRSKESFGIGEFLDLKKMVDWACVTGQKIIQTLPINDTTRFRTNADSYPYSAITVLGLHPAYIRPFALGELKDAEKMAYFRQKQAEFEQSPTVMYAEVTACKWEYFHLIFQQEGKKTLASAAYQQFLEENRSWLIPYAAFCFMRDKFHTANFHQWEMYSSYEKDLVEDLFTQPETAEEANLHLYLQFHAHRQLSETVAYASSKGVVLKGDIPIGISPESVEAWMEPHLFNLNSQTGAPPDPFSENGQNWGFPTYNWAEMQHDGYAWWKKRFQKMATYFKAYRIDHVLGFFRIWRMNEGDVYGLRGQFDPALPLTEDEIRSFGMWFEYHRMTHPYIREHILDDLFGKDKDAIKNVFLELVSPGVYRFQPEYDNQRKLEAFFQEEGEHWPFGDKNTPYYLALQNLHCEILFIEDCHETHKFHPRIGLQNTYSYRDLDDFSKAAINRLYNHFYYERHNEFWREQALQKLPALLDATPMLCCAEDLGMIPACVPQVMKQLHMLSLEIERMPKDSHDEFVPLHQIPRLSVCTTSTHDMAPIRGWWEEDRALTQRYYNQVLGEWGEVPPFCEPWICEKIINRHLYSPAMLVILPWQDWMSIDGEHRREKPSEERINIPSDPHHFWCYRMHIALEDLLQLDDLNARILQMAQKSGRIVRM